MTAYLRVWTGVAVVAAGAFAASAILQSPPPALLLLMAAVSVFGAAVLVRAPISSRRGRRQFARGLVEVAVLTLVIVGIGHHLAVGLVVVALLGITSPWAARRLTRG